jgi:hypothetical protein
MRKSFSLESFCIFSKDLPLIIIGTYKERFSTTHGPRRVENGAFKS